MYGLCVQVTPAVGHLVALEVLILGRWLPGDLDVRFGRADSLEVSRCCGRSCNSCKDARSHAVKNGKKLVGNGLSGAFKIKMPKCFKTINYTVYKRVGEQTMR